MNSSITPATGKSVTFAPNTKNAEKLLKQAARKGFYYPQLALKQIKSLSTGAIGKSNVFIPNINDSRAHSLQLFYIYVPGIRATIERRPNDSYVVTQLVVSDGYEAIGKKNRPGIYTVSGRGNSENDIRRKNNDRITPKENRAVIVCNTSYEKPLDAAQSAAKKLKLFGGIANTADTTGEFDFMYSPAGQKLGGMRNYDPSAITEGYAFASLLAKSMKHSTKTKHVHWISEHAGSTILTQAMEILDNQKISFETSKHYISLYKPRTDPQKTYDLTTRLKIKPTTRFVVQHGNLRTELGALSLCHERLKNKEDDYSLKDMASELATNSLVGVSVVGGAATSFSVAGMAGVPIVGAASTGAGLFGLGHLLWTRFKNLGA